MPSDVGYIIIIIILAAVKSLTAEVLDTEICPHLYYLYRYIYIYIHGYDSAYTCGGTL